MRKILASTYKELLILIRDLPGLLILFIMPVLMIIIVTLAQTSVLKRYEETKLIILYTDNDNSVFSRSIRQGFEKTKYFELIEQIQGIKTDERLIKESISKGKYQIGIVIHKGTNQTANDRAGELLKSFLNNNSSSKIRKSFKDTDFLKDSIHNSQFIKIYLDPAINSSYKTSICSSLQSIVKGAETKILIDKLFEILPMELNNKLSLKLEHEIEKQSAKVKQDFSKELQSQLGKMFQGNVDANQLSTTKIDINPIKNKQKIKINIFDSINGMSQTDFPWDKESLTNISEEYASKEGAKIKPSVVQNNVPAFTLFAMFFIVIPLSGSFLTEKNENIFGRLKTLPVAYSTIIFGKICIYTAVCIIQFILMILVGKYFLPVFFGLSPLLIHGKYLLVIVAALSSSFAAIGFGMLMGAIFNTHAQAAMFGSVMTIILALFGGIFVPVYLMPKALQTLSIISPIRWGIDVFLDIFVRGAGFITILPNIILLNLFFIFAVIISVFTFAKKSRN